MKNELNYASFESSKKLFETGVTLKTEFYWCKDKNGWYFFRAEEIYFREVLESIPAPSFAEIWRELPEDIFIEEEYYKLSIGKSDNKLVCCYSSQDGNFRTLPKYSENITDALAELLLWLKEKKK